MTRVRQTFWWMLLFGWLNACQWNTVPRAPTCETVADAPVVKTLDWKQDWGAIDVDITSKAEFIFSPSIPRGSQPPNNVLYRVQLNGQKTELKTGTLIKDPPSGFSRGGTGISLRHPGYISVWQDHLWVNGLGTFELRRLDLASWFLNEEILWDQKKQESSSEKFGLSIPIYANKKDQVYAFGGCSISKFQLGQQPVSVFKGDPICSTPAPAFERVAVSPSEKIYSIELMKPPFVPPKGRELPADILERYKDKRTQYYHQIYRTENGKLENWVGSPEKGFKDGFRSEARFSSPFSLAVARDDTLYVSDYDNHAIRKISPKGEVTTLAGNGQAGSSDGDAKIARFENPATVSLAPCHKLYVFDANGIREISLPPGPSSERWGEPVPSS